MKRMIYLLCTVIAYCFVWGISAHAHNQIDYRDHYSPIASIISDTDIPQTDILPHSDLVLLRENISNCDECYQEARFRGGRGGYRRPPTYSAPRVRAPPRRVAKPRVTRPIRSTSRSVRRNTGTTRKQFSHGNKRYVNKPYNSRRATTRHTTQQRRISQRAIKQQHAVRANKAQRYAAKNFAKYNKFSPKRMAARTVSSMRSFGRNVKSGAMRSVNASKRFVHKAKRSARYASIKTQRKARTAIKRTSAVSKAAMRRVGTPVSKLKSMAGKFSAKNTFASLKTNLLAKNPFKRKPRTCSFHGNTHVLTKTGYIAIKDLKIGDYVTAKDETTGAISEQKVLKTYDNPYKDTVLVRVQDKDGNISTITSNRYHPFYIQGKKWVTAENLKPNQELITSSGDSAKIHDITIKPEPILAYNITVENLSTYFVKDHNTPRAPPIWVHNVCQIDKVISSKRQKIKKENLPMQGKVRYIPPKNWKPNTPLPKGKKKGFIDKYGNEWVKGPSRTKGEAFEWDIQLSKSGKLSIGHYSKSGKHVNVSLKGRVTH